MESYVLSVVGVVIISAIADMITPEGKMKSVVRVVFSFVCIATFISPVIKIYNEGFNIENLIYSNEIQIDSNFEKYLTKIRIDDYVEKCEKELEKSNIYGVKVNITLENINGISQIKNITINLSNAVINEKNQHININKEAISCISKALNIDKEKVTVIE